MKYLSDAISMGLLVAAASVSLARPSFARTAPGAPTAIDGEHAVSGERPLDASGCPDAMVWDGAACVVDESLTSRQCARCPDGASWNGSTCVPDAILDATDARSRAVPTPWGCIAAAPAPRAAATSIRARMVRVPGGVARVGATGGAEAGPAHDAAIAGFSIDVTEVTARAYADCVHAGGCTIPARGAACNYERRGKGEHPINCVDWRQARDYCAWADKRLPTEEEWEYAARGPDARTFPWGDQPPTDKRLCWKKKGTCAVASFAAGRSASGLFDMAGDVWEWTGSEYMANYAAVTVDPAQHVLRGGAWTGGDPRQVETSFRAHGGSDQAKAEVGFRCAR